MSKKVLIILGHPQADSFCGALADSFAQSAEANGKEVSVLKLGELSFDPVLRHGYTDKQGLEPDLIRAQQLITEADQLAFIYPTWWGGLPALLKGFIDRIFLPEYAFSFKGESARWDKLLTGKSAQIITTMDSAPFFSGFIYKMVGHTQLKGILRFTGINPVHVTTFGPVKGSSAETRQKWLNKAADLATR